MSEAEEHRIMEAIRVMRAENREDFKAIFVRLDDFYKHGCAYAEEHKKIEPRVQTLELKEARREGRTAIAMILISACTAVIGNRITKIWALITS